MFSKKEYKNFISWYQLPSEPVIKSHKPPGYQPSQAEEFKGFISRIENTLNKGDIVDISIPQALPQGDFSISCSNKEQCNINTFSLNCQGNSTTLLLRKT